MAFDVCEHKIRQIIIKAAEELRKVKGLPEEKNITILFNEAAPLFGIAPISLSSRKDGDHFPAPHEMKDDKGKFIVPRRDCPQCHEKESMVLGPLCRSCEDAQKDEYGGPYWTMWQCTKCQFKEKSEKPYVKWLVEFGIDFQSGTKESLGIKTYTDEGMK
jgi:hypothetical protein